MPNVNLELSHESMDSLFVDLLNDNLTTLLSPVNFTLSVDDYLYNREVAEAIMKLMLYGTDQHAFDNWYSNTYLPLLIAFNEFYESQNLKVKK